MLGVWKRYFKDESGATAIEYGLIAAFVGLAVISGAQAVGLDLTNVFNNAAAAL